VTPKVIAIVLVLLVGGVAAYDIKFLMNREGSKKLAPAAEGAHYTADEPEQATPATGTRDTQQVAKHDEPQNIAGNETVSSLLDIFNVNGKWPEPFQGKAPTIETHAATTPEPPQGWSDPFLGSTPVVSAVLIGPKSRRAIVDRRIVREGDKLPGGAEVRSISPDGVEVRFGNVERLLPVGAAGSDAGTNDD